MFTALGIVLLVPVLLIAMFFGVATGWKAICVFLLFAFIGGIVWFTWTEHPFFAVVFGVLITFLGIPVGILVDISTTKPFPGAYYQITPTGQRSFWRGVRHVSRIGSSLLARKFRREGKRDTSDVFKAINKSL